MQEIMKLIMYSKRKSNLSVFDKVHMSVEIQYSAPSKSQFCSHHLPTIMSFQPQQLPFITEEWIVFNLQNSFNRRWLFLKLVFDM